MPRSRKGNRSGLLWGLMLLGTVTVASLAAYVKNTPASRVPVDELRASVRRDDGQERQVRVVSPSYEGSALKLDSKSERVPAGADEILFAVNRFLEEAKVSPSQAKAQGAKLDGDLLTLDFNKPFDKRYGTEDEQTLVKGILAAASQFEGVKRVKLTVEGEALESLGNIDLTEPQPVENAGGSATPPNQK